MCFQGEHCRNLTCNEEVDLMLQNITSLAMTSIVFNESEAAFHATCDGGMTFSDGSHEQRVNCTCDSDVQSLLAELSSLNASRCQGK